MKNTQIRLSLFRTVAQQRIDTAMMKVMMKPTIFFTNSYFSKNSSKGGSGLFMQKRNTDLKYDAVVENLLAKCFLVKCDAIQGTRKPKTDKLSPSYYKQHPSYFEASESAMKDLQVRFSRLTSLDTWINCAS